jgi:hypothetical protein
MKQSSSCVAFTHVADSVAVLTRAGNTGMFPLITVHFTIRLIIGTSVTLVLRTYAICNQHMTILVGLGSLGLATIVLDCVSGL